MAAETHPGSNNRGSYGPFRTLLATQSWRIAQFGYYYNACVAGSCPNPRNTSADVVFPGGVPRGGSTYFSISNLSPNYSGYIQFSTTPVVPQLAFQDTLIAGLTAAATISLNPPNPASVTLSLTTTGGTGAAVFAGNNSSTMTVTVSGPQQIQIKGVTVSSVASNIQLSASVNGIQRALNFTVIEPPPAVADNGVNTGDCKDESEKVAGCPINLTNGNVFIKQQDYTLPGLGGGITLERTWNSLWALTQRGNIPQVRMFGDSWTSSYEERVVRVDTQTVDYWRGDGSKWDFKYFNTVSGVDRYNCAYPGVAVGCGSLDFYPSIGQYVVTLAKLRSTRTFDPDGYPISITDQNGNAATFTYDPQRRLTRITDAASRGVTFTYGDSLNPNQVTAVQDAIGTVATYEYDGSGRLTRITYADGSYNRFNYDAGSLILSVTDTEEKVLESHTYDSSRRGLTSERANAVERLGVSYNGNGASSLTDSVGNVTQYAFMTINQRNVVTGVSGPGCASCGGRGDQTFTYDSYGQRSFSTDSLGNTTQWTYDSAGNVTRRSIVVNGAEVAWSFTYNVNPEPLTATDPLGNVTTNTYDANGNLLTTTPPSPGGSTAGSKTSFTYDAKGQLLTVTDPLNHLTALTYTAAGLVESVTDAQSKVTRYEYDARGNRTAIVDALNQRTTFAYDSRNRLTGITYPTTPATSTSFTYDSRGRRTSVTDANGKTTNYTYDDADRLIAVTDAQTPAGVTHYDYDSESNLITITDALGRVTRYDHDQQGRVTRTTFPSNLIETYIYDSLGNLISKTDRKNQTISYTYDALRRLTRKQYPDATQTNYTFDAASRLTQVTDPTGTYQYTYDNMGRLTQTSTVYSFITGKTFTLGYAWDAASNLTSMTDPQGGSTTYTVVVTNNGPSDVTHSAISSRSPTTHWGGGHNWRGPTRSIRTINMIRFHGSLPCCISTQLIREPQRLWMERNTPTTRPVIGCRKRTN